MYYSIQLIIVFFFIIINYNNTCTVEDDDYLFYFNNKNYLSHNRRLTWYFHYNVKDIFKKIWRDNFNPLIYEISSDIFRVNKYYNNLLIII